MLIPDVPQCSLVECSVNAVVNGYEVEHDFLDIGRKIILLNARKVLTPIFSDTGVVIGIIGIAHITSSKEVEVTLRYEESSVDRGGDFR